MPGASAFFIAILIASLLCTPPGQTQIGGATASAETAVKQEGCEVYFALRPIEPAAVKLLATPIVPVNRTAFTDASIRELQNWDLPSKVTAWRDRPSPQELARQWEELNKKWSAGARTDAAQGRLAPYSVGSLAAREWVDLEKWMGKNAPKKVPGLCIDEGKATYVLAVGFISGGAGVSSSDSNRVGEYTDYASKPRPDGFGPNSAKVPSHQTPNDEFTGSGTSGGLSGSTCVYLYPRNGKAIVAAGAREEAPEYYYCHVGGGISQSTVTTMLKYLSKSGLK